MGAISLYAEDSALVHGYANIKRHIFNHPEQNILLALVSIKTRPLNNPSSIRIPATFFTEIEKIEKSKMDEEKNLIRSTISVENPKDPSCLETQYPIQSVRTSKFGSYRRLPTGLQYFHTGLDLRAATGTPIYTMADGVVALSQPFIVPGNAVIVDHGKAIFSKYYHLSEPLVTPGQKVKKGDLIGKSGGTGRVEAPHLHWEVSWKGIPADPAAFVETTKSVCL